MAGYTIVADKTKKDTILSVEGKCPCCNSDNTSYVEQKNYYKGKKCNQFRYVCRKCGSIWLGNYYDNNYNMV